MARSIALPWGLVAVDSTTVVFLAATGWMTADAVDAVRVTMEILGRTGNIQIAPAYQVADTQDDDTATSHDIRSALTANGVHFWSGVWKDAKPDTQGRQLIRFGWRVSLTSGAALGTATVGGKVDIQGM